MKSLIRPELEVSERRGKQVEMERGSPRSDCGRNFRGWQDEGNGYSLWAQFATMLNQLHLGLCVQGLSC